MCSYPGRTKPDLFIFDIMNTILSLFSEVILTDLDFNVVPEIDGTLLYFRKELMDWLPEGKIELGIFLYNDIMDVNFKLVTFNAKQFEISVEHNFVPLYAQIY